MQDILKALETLTDDELETLIDHAEEILRERLSQVPLREDPAVGMWKDREDMKDSAAWVRKLRQSEWSDRV
jgi:flagellar motility protein MotE (MotC chaperone)